MNPCRRVDSLLSAHLDHETSPAELRFVEGHLTACPRCRDQAREVEWLTRRMRFLPRPVLSEDFTERVLAEATGRPAAGLEVPVLEAPPSARRTWGPALAAAAALAVVVFFGVTRLGPGDPAAPETVASAPASELPVPVDVAPVSLAEGPTPQVTTLEEADPNLRLGEGVTEAVPLGMATYVLEDWTAREPAGGGAAVLTRVGAEESGPVVVAF